ncbi:MULTISPECIES: hypothetical protein [unclassified Nocardia]|uniref:hypothetical protein n=1 Tax=unclassified Nocardia TaxID=2637762 RepID=UPI001CE3F202|nr:MULTISPECIES: hypothetical protein [unclassified Nocardia]
MTVLRRCLALAAVLAAPLIALPSAAADPAVVPDARQEAAAPGDLLAAYQASMDRLRAFGMDPFIYPTAAAFCTSGSVLGMSPAVGVAMPGPWPKTTLTVPGLDLSAAKAGQTLFTFVPYGIGRDSAHPEGMRVAWINLGNGRSGIADMGPLSDIFRGMVPASVPATVRPAAERAVRDFFFAALPAGGVRAVPVDTGSGTVLAAMFGTVDNGGVPCFFLPTVGVVAVP